MNKIDKIQFGDFQTPLELSKQVVSLIARIYGADLPQLIIEPSCGKGTFVFTSLERFPAAKIIASDANADYIAYAIAQQETNYQCRKELVEFSVNDFFKRDWEAIFNENKGKDILILGNPPWVTNSELGELNSCNLPKKSNFQNYEGLEALLGSSNFDISEFMVLQYMEWLKDKKGLIAVLCKLSVARKLFKQKGENFKFSIYKFDAKKYFKINAEACLLIIDARKKYKEYKDCPVFSSFDSEYPMFVIGRRDGILLNDIEKFEFNKKLLNNSKSVFEWRSGVKHDCIKVMEFQTVENMLINGFSEEIQIEQDLIYPLLKGSDVANGRVDHPRKLVLITQQFVGQDTNYIRDLAPKTWKYLEDYSDFLNKRKSSIYRNRPKFSIFGIGDYVFKPWKIAICSMYKNLNFQIVPPYQNKPVVFDDTVNFLGFHYHQSVELVFELLTSKIAKDFLESMIFYDDKRPITINILSRLSLESLAKENGLINQYYDVVNNELNLKGKL